MQVYLVALTCIFSLALGSLMCSAYKNWCIVQKWFCWSGCSCNGKSTFCVDVAELCSESWGQWLSYSVVPGEHSCCTEHQDLIVSLCWERLWCKSLWCLLAWAIGSDSMRLPRYPPESQLENPWWNGSCSAAFGSGRSAWGCAWILTDFWDLYFLLL